MVNLGRMSLNAAIGCREYAFFAPPNGIETNLRKIGERLLVGLYARRGSDLRQGSRTLTWQGVSPGFNTGLSQFQHHGKDKGTGRSQFPFQEQDGPYAELQLYI